MTDPLALLAAFALTVLAVARAVRLVVHDPWPPIAWVRDRWVARTALHDPQGLVVTDQDGDPVPGPWTKLLTCPFCAAPYIAAVTLAAGHVAGVWSPDLGTLAGWWWTLAVWATVSYLAPMVVLRDEPPPVDE